MGIDSIAVQIMDDAYKRPEVLRRMLEKEWTDYVIAVAHENGWLVHHDIDRADHNRVIDPGFPDLVLAKHGHLVIFAELKKERQSNPTGNQAAWSSALDPGAPSWTNDVSHVVYLWRPSDWPQVKAMLHAETK